MKPPTDATDPAQVKSGSPVDGMRSVLVIGATADVALPWVVPGVMPGGAQIEITTMPGLDAALLARLRPDCILAPLMAPGVDILDVAARLDALSYSGLLLAITPPLPNPGIVRREVRLASPGLRFDLIELPANPS